jgi:hypothetical protein
MLRHNVQAPIAAGELSEGTFFPLSANPYDQLEAPQPLLILVSLEH